MSAMQRKLQAWRLGVVNLLKILRESCYRADQLEWLGLAGKQPVDPSPWLFHSGTTLGYALLLCEGVNHPRFDRLAAIAPKRIAYVRAAGDRLQVVAHDVVEVARALCLQLSDRRRVC